MMRHLLATCALMTVLALPAFAQDAAQQATAEQPAAEQQEATATPALNSGAPVEISADKGLVWDRTAHTYTAKGRAEARQGDMKVTSDVLVARYDAAGGSSDIREVTADGNVVLTSAPYTAYGEKAVYDLTSGVAVLTGNNLRVMTPGETLTARDRLTYAANDGQMTAEGNAKLTRPNDSLEAQAMTAKFATLADGKRGLETVTATGGVTIKTVRETITGAKGVYHAANQTAELTGDVVITQGKNRLEGRRATVDMKSGVSQIYGAASEGGRVKGVFYPKDKTAQAVVPAAATATPAVVPTVAETPVAVDAKPAEIKKSPSIVDDVQPVDKAQPLAETPAPVITPVAEPAPQPTPAPLPAQEVVTDVVKEEAKAATPVGEPITPAQEKAVADDVKKETAAPVDEVAPAIDVKDLPPEPFAVPPANAVSPTESSTPAAVDKPDLNP